MLTKAYYQCQFALLRRGGRAGVCLSAPIALCVLCECIRCQPLGWTGTFELLLLHRARRRSSEELAVSVRMHKSVEDCILMAIIGE